MAPPFRTSAPVEEEGPALSKKDIAARVKRLQAFTDEVRRHHSERGEKVRNPRWTEAKNRLFWYEHGDRSTKWARNADTFLGVNWPGEFDGLPPTTMTEEK